jgi:hypothetical protein
MSHVRKLITAGAIVAVGAIGAGAGVAAAAAPTSAATTSGTDLNADLHQADAGEHATANDVESAAQDVDNGPVSNVDSQDNQTGTVETGTANDVADASGDKNDTPSGTSHESGASGRN